MSTTIWKDSYQCHQRPEGEMEPTSRERTPKGLIVTAEEMTRRSWTSFDAVFVSVMDVRNLIDMGTTFRSLGIPLRRTSRQPGGGNPRAGVLACRWRS